MNPIAITIEHRPLVNFAIHYGSSPPASSLVLSVLDRRSILQYAHFNLVLLLTVSTIPVFHCCWNFISKIDAKRWSLHRTLCILFTVFSVSAPYVITGKTRWLNIVLFNLWTFQPKHILKFAKTRSLPGQFFMGFGCLIVSIYSKFMAMIFVWCHSPVQFWRWPRKFNARHKVNNKLSFWNFIFNQTLFEICRCLSNICVVFSTLSDVKKC